MTSILIKSDNLLQEKKPIEPMVRRKDQNSFASTISSVVDPYEKYVFNYSTLDDLKKRSDQPQE